MIPLLLLPNLSFSAERTTPVGPDLENADLQEQLSDDPARVIPRTPAFAAAVDVHGIYRTNDEGGGLYHSGIWIDLYSEARPFPDLVANLRLSVLNPGSSYGIVNQTDLVAWPRVTWTPSRGELHAAFQAFDLGRRSLGAGLLVQDQEGSGLAAVISRRDARLRMNWFGTNTFGMDGDLLSLGVDFWDDALGVAGFGMRSWTGEYGAVVCSAHRFASGFTPLAEGAFREGQPAGMLGLKLDRDEGARLAGGGTVQGRFYAQGFGEGLVQEIAHDYLAPEQELLDFVRADNVFVYDDGVWLGAARLWGVVRVLPWLSVRVDEEVAGLSWLAPDKSYPTYWHWWRYDAIACARAPDNICFDAFLTNRMTSAVFLPTEEPDQMNYPMLFDRTFIGLEARARF